MMRCFFEFQIRFQYLQLENLKFNYCCFLFSVELSYETLDSSFKLLNNQPKVLLCFFLRFSSVRNHFKISLQVFCLISALFTQNCSSCYKVPCHSCSIALWIIKVQVLALSFYSFPMFYTMLKLQLSCILFSVQLSYEKLDSSFQLLYN